MSNMKMNIADRFTRAVEDIKYVSTPSINLNDDHFGFEEELRDAADKICLETLMLLNGSKLGVQQLTIDDAIAANANKIAEGDQNLFEKDLTTEELTDEVDHDNAVDEEFPDVDSFTDTDKDE